MKGIALVAYDNKKMDMVEWCDFNKGTLSHYCLYATGGTGRSIIEKTSLKINLLKSGPGCSILYVGDLVFKSPAHNS